MLFRDEHNLSASSIKFGLNLSSPPRPPSPSNVDTKSLLLFICAGISFISRFASFFPSKKLDFMNNLFNAKTTRFAIGFSKSREALKRDNNCKRIDRFASTSSFVNSHESDTASNTFNQTILQLLSSS